jgi:hypothetical protein
MFTYTNTVIDGLCPDFGMNSSAPGLDPFKQKTRVYILMGWYNVTRLKYKTVYILMAW